MSSRETRKAELKKQLLELADKNTNWLKCPYIKKCKIAKDAGIDPGSLINKLKNRNGQRILLSDLEKLEKVKQEILKQLL
jgi:hypothetical protein